MMMTNDDYGYSIEHLMDVKGYRKETLSEMIFLIFQVEEAKRKSREETAYNKNAKLIIQSQDDSAA